MCLFKSTGNFDIMSNIIEKGILKEFWRSVNSPNSLLNYERYEKASDLTTEEVILGSPN